MVNRFLLAGVLLLWSVSARAQGKPLEVTADNFVSLEWRRSGGYGNTHEFYKMWNRQGRKENVLPKPEQATSTPFPLPLVVPFSENQWREFLERVNELDVPSLAGSYNQVALDGMDEKLTLTVSDAQNLDQSFTITITGSATVPASYHKFTSYLERRLSRKFFVALQHHAATSTPQ